MPNCPYYKTPHWKVLRLSSLKRDNYTCVVPGCRARATLVDHIKSRGSAAYPTALDTLDNTRSLCAVHANQVRETRAGDDSSRAQGGHFRVKGCDPQGWPLDPARR